MCRVSDLLFPGSRWWRAGRVSATAAATRPCQWVPLAAAARGAGPLYVPRGYGCALAACPRHRMRVAAGDGRIQTVEGHPQVSQVSQGLP